MTRSLFAAIAVGFNMLLPVRAMAVGTVVIGPGPQPLIYETSNVDYHVLDGTQIISPSMTGPPSTFVVPTDAIEFRGGGHIQIDGGYYRGGDATYTGSSNSATAAAAEALHLRQSSGEVLGGTFIGGKATTQSPFGHTHGGSGLVLVESSIVIRGGYFEGGTATRKGTDIGQQPSIYAYPGSFIDMYGGTVGGEIYLQNSTLLIHGTELSYTGTTLSGKYLNGTPFSHAIRSFQGTVLFNVPEPSCALLLAFAGCTVIRARRRKRAA